MTKREFRDKHIPALRALCADLGLPLAWRNVGYQEAYGSVMARAMECGASHLTTRALADLERWVCEALTASAAKHTPAAEAYFAQAAAWAAEREAWIDAFHRQNSAPEALAA